MKTLRIFLGTSAVLLSIGAQAEIRAGNVVIDANGIQVGDGIRVGGNGVRVGDTKVAPGGIQTNGISVGPNGIQVPAGSIDDTETDDRDDVDERHEPGHGAGAGAGVGAGRHAGNKTKINVNRNRGSIVIDGEPVHNQTIINRSDN